ncbi:uncharacterized protein [Montipora foliosa]|uniref:uncharacterized protein n=1 Tax=Montipora foliosa TaxID=591990 RepID=UPI0035F1B879
MADNSQGHAKVHPLVIFYDSEAAYGNVFSGDIIEIAAKCHPDVVKGSFQSLINTKQPLCAFATKECSISENDLRNKPYFKDVLKKFLSWIDNMVKQAKKRHGKPYVPVLCAHHGYQFDFLILLSNMERSGLHHSILTQHNIHFADSLLFCFELKSQGENLLSNTRLSLDGLFKRFFPRRIIEERHRAMGDVKAMVDIFVYTPLKELLHCMKYSSTKERLDYYLSQAGFKQQQAILEENFCHLDACSRNMSVKKLLKEGITYNSLISIFEECCSFMDFYETMKTYGIERKVAKVIALHFSGKGLENQGAKAYSKLHGEKLISFDSAQETSEGQRDGSHPLQGELPDRKDEPKADGNRTSKCQRPESRQKPKVSSVKKQLYSKPMEEEVNGDWEHELAMAEPRTNFTLKCTTATPLSLGVDDFSSAPLRPGGEKNSPEESKIAQCHPETNGSCTMEMNIKRPHTRLQGRGRRFSPKSPLVSSDARKRGGSRNKPVDEPKREGSMKRDATSCKNETKGLPAKSVDGSQELSSLKEKDQSCCGASLTEQEMSNNVERKGLACDQMHLSGEDSQEKIETKSPLATASVVKKFASVMIGDIAIAVPVADSEKEHDPSGTASKEKGSVKGNQTEDKTDTDSKEVNTWSTSQDSSSAAVEIPQVQLPKPDPGASCLQSAYTDLKTPFQDQNEKDCVAEYTNACKLEAEPEKLVDKDDSSVRSPCAVNHIESSCQKVNGIHQTTTDIIVEAVNSENCHPFAENVSSVVDPRQADEETNIDKVRADCDSSGVTQDPVPPVINPSNESIDEGTESVHIPWDKLQQLPHAPSHEDVSMLDRFVMSEGLACHGVHTDDIENTRHDMQAELSSESSSSSGEFMDGFYRHPPLGAERGFTPDQVQQQPPPPPNQVAWEGSISEGVYPTPSIPSFSSVVGLSYPQGAFQSYGYPYAGYHQAQQPLHPLKPYYSSFGYPRQMRHIAVQPQHQVLVSPYLQNRNQIVFTNTVSQVTGFPTTVTPASHIRPLMYQVWHGPANYPFPTVPFYGNQYDQVQECTRGILNVGSIHQSIGAPQVNSSVEYQNPVLNPSGTAGCDTRPEPGSESLSRGSPFEPITGTVSGSSFYSVHALSSVLDKESTENDIFVSALADDQLFTEQELNPVETPGCVNTCETSLVQFCDKEVSGNKGDALNTTETPSDTSSEFSRHTVPPDEVVHVHKKITILSREDRAMKRRLSPDGSSMEGVCGDISSCHSIKEPSKQVSGELMERDFETWTDDTSVRGSGLPPKPQRIKGIQRRKNKSIQHRGQPTDSKPSNMVSSDLAKIPESVEYKIGSNSNELVGQKTSVARDLQSANLFGCKSVASTEMRRPLCTSDGNVETNVASSSRLVADTSPLMGEGRHGPRRQESSSQRPGRKRVFNNKGWSPYSGKKPQRDLSKLKEQKSARTDTNNNSGVMRVL